MKNKLASRQAGVTLIEACIVMAVAATLVGTGVPSFKSMLERRTLEGRAGELSTDLQFLRSEAVSRNHAMRISFGSDAGGSCYVLHSGSSGDCRCSSAGTAQCTEDAIAVKAVGLPQSSGVRLQSNVATMLFDPLHGTASPTGTLRLIDRSDRAIHHVVNIMGRVRSCSPGGVMTTYKAC